ncbi:MAG: ComEA family DNA-binding protein [Candidatus Roizmanbacteria bacterium]|nr:ComEA family DNA-binding protein [Candidatus Roizmanbacteria bacterium]
MLVDYFSRFKVSMMLASIGFMCLVIFAVLLVSESANKQQVDSGIEIEEQNFEGGIDNTRILYVDIQGAVEKPGIYELEEDARIVNLIDTAGGYSVEADMDWISKNINQAQLLQDGTKLYIPFKGENTSNTTIEASTISININTATITDLESLNGIGEKRAQQIIDGRPYSSVEELLEKGIVGEKTFEAIKDQIIVY